MLDNQSGNNYDSVNPSCNASDLSSDEAIAQMNAAVHKFWPDWNIMQLIGEGGFGAVYRAERTDVGREQAAIKVINVSQKGSVSLVEQEILSMRKLKENTSNGNIVRIEDYHKENNLAGLGAVFYIRMEYLTPLSDYITDEEMCEEEVLHLGIDVCKALEACERNGIIHRDIKPTNILYHEKTHQFKLGDFGLAKLLNDKSDPSCSQSYQVGSDPFMAPEVYNNLRRENYGYDVDTYSLGIVLYFLLNKKQIPFEKQSRIIMPTIREAAIKERNVKKRYPFPLPCCISDESREIVSIIKKACDPKPGNRYLHATDMRKDLEIAISRFSDSDEVSESSVLLSSNKLVQPGKTKEGRVLHEVPQYAVDHKSRLPVVLGALAVVGLISVSAYLFFSRGNNHNVESIASSIDSQITTLATSDSVPTVDKKLEEEREKKEKEKSSALKRAESQASSGDYAEAILIIREAQNKNGEDPDYSNAIELYLKKYKEKVLDDAANLSKDKDYAGAITILRNATDLAEDPDIDFSLKENETAYRKSALSRAASALKKDGYAKAVKILNDGLEVLPDDQRIMEQIEQYKPYEPVALLKTESYYYETLDSVVMDVPTRSKGSNEIIDYNIDISSSSGNQYIYGLLIESDAGYHSKTEDVYYKINSNYDTLTGVIVYGKNSDTYVHKDELTELGGLLKLYNADTNELLYSSPLVNCSNDEVPINIDISGVNAIRISLRVTSFIDSPERCQGYDINVAVCDVYVQKAVT